MKSMMFLAALVLVGCSTKRVPISAKPAELKDVVSFNTPFIKSKGGKMFSGEFTIQNLNSSPIIVYLHDITCNWGKQMGAVRNDRPFNIGERTINIPGNSIKIAKLRCDVAGDGEGEMSITVRRVYKNPTGDGKTTGDVLGENITWKNI